MNQWRGVANEVVGIEVESDFTGTRGDKEDWNSILRVGRIELSVEPAIFEDVGFLTSSSRSRPAHCAGKELQRNWRSGLFGSGLDSDFDGSRDSRMPSATIPASSVCAQRQRSVYHKHGLLRPGRWRHRRAFYLRYLPLGRNDIQLFLRQLSATTVLVFRVFAR